MRTLVGYDSETYPVAPGRKAPPMVCGSFAGGDLAGPVVELASAAKRRVWELLHRQDVELVGANIAFDLGVLCQEDPAFFPVVFRALDEGRIWCVTTYEALRAVSIDRRHYDPEIGSVPKFSLAECVLKYVGRDRSAEKKGPDVWRGRYRELEGVPVERWPVEAVRYCEADALDPLLVRAAQLEATDGELPLARESFRHAFAFYLMGARGVRTDAVAVAELEARLVEAVEAARPRLVEAGLLRKDGSENTKVTKGRVLALLGDGAPLTAKGKEVAEERDLTPAERLKYTSTAEAVLELVAGQDRILDLWREVKADRKELSDFVPKLRAGAELPINPRWNAIVDTFRASCSGPNLQQQPRRPGVRECFVPRPGFLYCASDYHVAELCSLAQLLLDLFGFSTMAEEIRAGRDLHLVFAAELAGLSYEETVRRYRAGDARIKELRSAAKVANFGIPGGLGVDSLVSFARGYGVILTREEATDLRDRWLSRFPEMRRYFQWISQQCAGGSFTHIHPRTGFVRGGVRYCDGANHGFQHLTACGAKDALYLVAREAYTDPTSPLYGSYPVIFVHDELIVEVRQDRAAAAAARISAIMVEAMSKYTPDIPSRADAALMRRWYKAAEPEHNAAGELVPWEPAAH